MENHEFAQQVKDIKAALAHSKGDQILNFDGLCLFLNVKLSENFKIPDIEKFKGTGNSTSHVRHIINTLKPMGLNDELIAQLFQRTLTGCGLDWFLTLDFTKYEGWQRITNAFINQYAYNVQIELEDVFHILEATGDLKPLQPKFPSNLAQKGGEYCKYHQVTGHSIEQCGALKNAVQDHIDQEIIDPTKLDD
ncbi:hypothetical protein RHMOL_Rhmol02G0140600 [Rhododendron molle]|uniref:Uncharacterized protein n=1 Tax=Rhododendron molle TaxID=49168 RepID=A0ACC0PPM8_RHOML|nr:hypothetical protein RHMOL_Rhmol02G0140600 [Rhododendron molle]